MNAVEVKNREILYKINFEGAGMIAFKEIHTKTEKFFDVEVETYTDEIGTSEKPINFALEPIP